MNQKHIAHLTTVHPPFDVRIFHKQCRSLVKVGYKVTLVAPGSGDEAVDDIQIISVKRAGTRIGRITGSILQVYRKARQLKADLYHFHDPELISVGLILRALGKRVVYDIHEDVPRALFALSRNYIPNSAKQSASWLIEQFENNAARMFSGLIAATPAIGERFRALNPHTEVINNFPISDELIASAEVPWEKRSLSVVYAGAISFERGIREMVEAMSRLPKQLDVRLKLAGSFSPLHTRDSVTRLPGWQQVDELGFINRDQMAGLLGQVCAGLVIFYPDPNHLQAQPNKLFECMSAGIPIIISDFPLWRKIIEQVGCGLLVDPLDSQAVATAIEYLMTHPAEAEAMGSRGKKAVSDKYNWENEQQKLFSFYEKLLEM